MLKARLFCTLSLLMGAFNALALQEAPLTAPTIVYVPMPPGPVALPAGSANIGAVCATDGSGGGGPNTTRLNNCSTSAGFSVTQSPNPLDCVGNNIGGNANVIQLTCTGAQATGTVTCDETMNLSSPTVVQRTWNLTCGLAATPPDLSITKSHTGNFNQGQVGATYTITVSNAGGAGPTDGTTVTVTDTLPGGLTATSISGTGWTCTQPSGSCTRSDVLAAGASYPDITLTVNVGAAATSPQVNMVTVSGGGDASAGNNSANDSTTIVATPPDLSITKSHTGNFTQGQNGATYTITVSNAGGAGPTDGTTVTVTDTLPGGLTATAISGTGWTCTQPSGSCTRSDVLAAGASYPAITLTVNVGAAATSPQVNMASVSGGGDASAGNNSANDSTTIDTVTPPDLSITKTHTGNFIQGQTGATYTITVSNAGGAGPTDGSTVTVTDTLPTGLTATAISGTGWSCTLGTLTCTRTTVLAPGASYPAITLTVDVAGNASTPKVNTADVSGGGDVTAGNNTAMDSTIIDKDPDLTIAKTHTGNFTQGQTGATYTITVSSAGGGGDTDGSTVSVIDSLPAGMTATAISGTGWSCTLGTLTCTRSDILTAGSSYPAITLTVDVSATAGSPLVNSVTVSGGGDITSGNNTDNDSTNINKIADLTITKTHAGNFTQGQTGATYTITVSNVAGAGATDGSTVTVTDTLPAGLTATAISGTGWTCTQPSGPCTRTTNINQNQSYPAITLTVNVASNATSPQVNMVSVSGGGDLTPANDSASDSTTIVQKANLSITKTHAGNFTQGQVGATYTITVSNAAGSGPTDGTSVSVTDTLPAGLTATAMSGTGWTCTLATLFCSRTDVLAAGASYPAITLTVDVAAAASSPQVNNVSVSGGGDNTPANNNASDSTNINAAAPADLSIAKTHAGNFTQGQVGATYTITVSNAGAAGPTNGTTVTVTDTLPAGLTATAISGTGWACVLGTLTCTRTTVLSAGASYPAITLTVDVGAAASSPQVNNVSVSGGGDVTAGNNSASDSTTINPAATPPDLTIAKTHVGNFTQGQVGATYTITVSDAGGAGPTDGTTVTVTDTLPAGLTATAISGTGWACVLGTLTCTRSDVLTAGSSYPAITLTVTVGAAASSPQVNNVSVSGGGDVTAGNDSASDSTTINPAATPPDLTIAKTHAGNFTQGQVGATYTITVSDALGAGPTDGTTVTVTDALPAGLSATAIGGTGWNCVLATLTCTRVDSIAAGMSYPPITLTVNVSPSAMTVTNTATVAGGGDATPNNDTSGDQTIIVAPVQGGVVNIPAASRLALALLALAIFLGGLGARTARVRGRR